MTAVLVGLLAGSASAADIRAGHNFPTKRLEAAFKVAVLERKQTGCYPAPAAMAEALRNAGIKAGVVKGFKSVRRRGVVFVIKRGTTCGRLILALRFKKDLYVLNSARGLITVKGRKGRERDEPGGRGPLRGVKLVSKSFVLSGPNEVKRLLVLCPKKTFPLGGGMRGTPPPGADGEGIYPHSYERLGAQRGWHINPVLLDPSPAATTPRQVTLQVACGRGVVPAKPTPHRTVFIRPGETRTATATCPKGQHLFSGGFQRTDFRSPGGSYPTESRAIGTRAWRVTGRAFGIAGGELTAIAYCTRDKSERLSEVSASTSVPAGGFATATTPPCPKGRRLTAGGFSADGSQNLFFADGFLNRNGTWSASAFGYFGSAASFNAHGYCLRVSKQRRK